MNRLTVIGAGLAGCEAAWQLANRGHKVMLVEMKPVKFTPAHSYKGFGELVCSNSLKAYRVNSAAGLLKAEMKKMGSLIVEAGEATKVAAGGALAVNRELFSDFITEKIKSHDNIEIICKEQVDFPDKNAVIATGPLTSDAFAEQIKGVCGDGLSFYDAAAPIITKESIDMTKAFMAARYDRGGADYINCPMDYDAYYRFHEELVNAVSVPLKEFESLSVYEGCMPVEVLAKRGADALRYGCMKPVGLIAPNTKRRPYAVVQLRKENNEGTLYNIVGFQTNLKFGEQKRVFSMISGLENAEFIRYGVMHRNTFINSPKLLSPSFKLKNSDNIFFAGQITGVEGYTESAMSGILAGINLSNSILGKDEFILPKTTMSGALSSYISDNTIENFQPMGANMGILPMLDKKIRSREERYQALADRALSDLNFLLKGQAYENCN